ANVVSAKSANADAAWKFVKYLGSEEAATVQAATGTVIPAYQGTQKAWVDASPQFNLQVFLDAVAYAKPLPVSKNTAVWNELEAKYLTEAWALRMPVPEAATQLAQEMNAALAAEPK
ncbi:MAG: sugar ABC transporter substrate-binding protein, partial [Actinomycetia bacterium]|nr:sugar ABC transporter substrate-binding protein [Actinomycetes bacterium]